MAKDKEYPYNAAADTNNDSKVTKKEWNTWNDKGRPVDKVNMENLGNQFGYAAGYIEQNPELLGLLKKLLKGNVTDAAMIQATIKGSDWYKSFEPQYQLMQQERAQLGEEGWANKVSVAAEDIKKRFRDAGAEIDDATARKYAEQFLLGSSGKRGDGFQMFNEKWLKDTINSAIDFTKKSTVGGVEAYDLEGDAGAKGDELYKLAYDYGMDTSTDNKTFTSWFENNLKQYAGGTLAINDVTDSLKEYATSMFPSLAGQINAGVTLRQAVQPYTYTIANELEMDYQDFDLNDDVLRRVLNTTDEQGNHKAMNLYETGLAARKDPRWKRTGKAKEEYSDIANTILKSFGFQGV